MKRPPISYLIVGLLLSSQLLIAQCLKEDFLSKNNSELNNFKKFNINNLSTFIYSNGKADIDGGMAGFQYPKGSNKYAIYTSGFLVGGKVDNILSVCGSLSGNNISIGGIGENWLESSWDSTGIYRVRPDYKTASFVEEEKDEYKTVNKLREEYENDWNSWPSEHGAPFQDNNLNGVYEVSGDVPGIAGAAQTLWYVANAADSTVAGTLFQSPPLDLEVTVTVWGYNDGTYRDNVVFKKFILTNKGSKEITDMYFSQYVDPDIGNAGDDFAGCDTSLHMAYAYNGYETDYSYNNNPPAIGFVFLKGAKIEGKYKGMTSFVYWLCSTSTFEYSCPHLDEYQGAIDTYNYMQGKMLTGEYIKIPDELGGGHTKFRAPGDPVTGTGWIDGVYIDPTSDRYFLTSTGPFNLAPGESEEIILAQIAAGGRTGIGHLEAVAELKETARQVLEDYGQVVSTEKTEELPTEIKLYQNYPNPFNPKSKIKYQIVKSGKVELVVYDLLGKIITSLVDEDKPAGTYEVEFDGENLSSGIYFYELRVGDHSQQRKMILLK
ncbi:MAG: T9SS type A sorting domain-containing protein [Bacteroidetes bacterium]|nr:T9SS type A sorting domain-containing protein [Bacteroidota bacterium]